MPNPGDPQSLNRYSYCIGNPLKYIDPSGHSWDDFINFVRKVPGYETTANNLDTALTIVQHPEASAGEKALAGGYIAVEATAHGALLIGGSILAWEGIGAIAGTAASGEAITTAGTAATAACADGDCTNEAQAVGQIANRGWTVLGKYPGYVDTGNRLQVNFLKIPQDIWEKLATRAQQWAMNQQFLDEAITRGDVFFLDTPFVKGIFDKGSFFQQELQYLIDKGYQLVTVNGQDWLLPLN